MLQIIFIVLALINFLIFLFKNKKINFLLIYFCSSCLYYSNAFFNKIFFSSNDHISGFFYSTAIDDKTYILMIINMLLILFFSLFSITRVENDTVNINNKKKLLAEKCAINTLIFLNLLISFYVLLTIMPSFISGTYDKGTILNNSSALISYYKDISTFLFIYFFAKNNNVKYKKISYFLICYFIILTIILGHRSYFVIGIIAIFINLINEKVKDENTNLLNLVKLNLKKIIVIILLFFVFMVSKNIYTSLFNGNYELVLSRLSDVSYYKKSFQLTEFNTIFNNLNTVVVSNFKMSGKIYLRIATLIVPFLNRFIDIDGFSTVYQLELFGKTNLASTFIGEAYSAGTYGMVFVVIVFILLLNVFFDSQLNKCRDNIWKTFLLYSGVDISFYIHRNSLETCFTRIRVYLYIVILLKLFELIYRRLIKQNEK